MRFKVSRINTSTVEVLVEGCVTLGFRDLGGVIRKVYAFRYDRRSAVVSKHDFLEARSLARKELTSAPTPNDVERALAKKVIASSRKHHRSLEGVIKSIDPGLRDGVMMAIGEIGGQASHARATARAKNIKKERNEQLKFKF